MELAYLYINEYRNLKDIEFNFSQTLRINYKKKNNKLSIKEKDNTLSDNFWGENINNLTMIVGKNGVGKTSLMQYIISIWQSLISQERPVAEGIIVLQEKERIVYYVIRHTECNLLEPRISLSPNLELKGFKIKELSWGELKYELETVKLIYLTNAISYADYHRNDMNSWNRFTPLYDCSVGGLMYLDSVSDVNRELRRHYIGISEFENYYTYEKYRQVKFVFDKNQHRNLEQLEAEGYHVPVPNKLYINLFLDNQLRFLQEKATVETHPLYDLDKKLFPGEVKKMEMEILWWGQEEVINTARLLRYQFCRCCIWGMIRSIIRNFEEFQRVNFISRLIAWDEYYEIEDDEFLQTVDRIWDFSKKFIKEAQIEIESGLSEFEKQCKQYYISFIDYIENADLEKHFSLESSFREVLETDMKDGIIRLSVSTSDDEWFIEFLQKYRYTSNPDYYLDFDWGLSSGETNLLSVFSLLYCIFPMDYTNQKNGKYRIYNEWRVGRRISCNSLIIMVDEADLTFHPEWQQEYIALLIAFLSKIYPNECCENIQLILSTHSPILLSDVPQQNVICLEVNEKNKVRVVDSTNILTFGQNIHLLYREGFFLRKGTMGKFAHDKIQECFEKLEEIDKAIEKWEEYCDRKDFSGRVNEIYQELNEQRRFVMLVAEPIIKKRLLMEIEEIEQKLPKKERLEIKSEGSESKFVETLPDDKLDVLLEQLIKERNRRRNDKNSNL